MKSYDIPGGQPFDSAGNWTTSWAQWLSRTHRAALASQQSGTTADRPTTLLWVGRFYYDEDLGYPVWLHSINPIVWHDASGAPA